MAASLHFAAEFLVLAVATGAALDSVRDRSRGPSRALGMALGFAVLAAAQVVHGIVVDDDASRVLIALRAGGVALVVATAFGARSARSLLAAAGTLAAAEAIALVAPAGEGAATALSHSLRVAAAVVLAQWLRHTVARSIRLRFLAAFVVGLLAVILMVSMALNQVIAANLEREELRRLELTGSGEVRQLVERGASAQEFAGAVAGNRTIAESMADERRQRNLPGAARLLLASFTRGVDFLLFVDERGRVLGSAGGAPSRALPRAEELAIAGSDVVREVLEAGRPVASADSVAGRQVVVLGGAPVGFGGRLVGAVALGVRISGATVRELAEDTGGAVSLLVQGGVVSSSLREQDEVAAAFARVGGAVRSVREQGDPARVSLSYRGTRYLTVLVPIRRADDVPVGILAFSRPAEVLTPARRSIDRTLFVIALAAAIMAAALAWLAGGRFTRPIRSLTRAAEELRGGNLEARATVESGDEVGLLGGSFNEMAASLAGMTSDLRSAAVEEAALRNRMEAIMQSMGDGLVATDAAGRVVAFNRAAEEMVGYRAEEALGRPLEEVLRGRAAGATLAEAALDGTSGEAVLERGSAAIPLALTSAPLVDAGGRAVGRVVVFRDVSTEREAERMKTEFLSNVSHELRTPLTPIRGYAEILKRKEVPAERRSAMLDVILDSTARLERIVAILVDVAAIEAGRLRPRIEAVPVREVVDEVVRAWSGEKASHRFVRRLAADLPRVAADAKLLGRCLSELVDNAVKFSPPGTRIEISAEPVAPGPRRKPTAVRISVRDRGEGIADDAVPFLFQDFRQLDGSETRSIGGLGLGLSYVRRIAAVHGGDVAAESRPGEGSTFSITLPVADAARAPGGGERPAREATRRVAASPKPGAARRRRSRPVLKVVTRTDRRRSR